MSFVSFAYCSSCLLSTKLYTLLADIASVDLSFEQIGAPFKMPKRALMIYCRQLAVAYFLCCRRCCVRGRLLQFSKACWVKITFKDGDVSSSFGEYNTNWIQSFSKHLIKEVKNWNWFGRVYSFHNSRIAIPVTTKCWTHCFLSDIIPSTIILVLLRLKDESIARLLLFPCDGGKIMSQFFRGQKCSNLW